jgi:hypothetical protein
VKEGATFFMKVALFNVVVVESVLFDVNPLGAVFSPSDEPVFLLCRLMFLSSSKEREACLLLDGIASKSELTLSFDWSQRFFNRL